MSTAPSVENWFAHLSAERNQSSQKCQRRKTRMSLRKCFSIHLRCCVLVQFTWTCISYINMHAYIMFTLSRYNNWKLFFLWDGIFTMQDKYQCMLFIWMNKSNLGKRTVNHLEIITGIDLKTFCGPNSKTGMHIFFLRRIGVYATN